MAIFLPTMMGVLNLNDVYIVAGTVLLSLAVIAVSYFGGKYHGKDKTISSFYKLVSLAKPYIIDLADKQLENEVKRQQVVAELVTVTDGKLPKEMIASAVEFAYREIVTAERDGEVRKAENKQ